VTIRDLQSSWRLTPGVVLGILGMFGAIAGAWMSFESRITRVESDYRTTVERLDRMDNKLDRLIERDSE
jgi:hypothetical protein